MTKSYALNSSNRAYAATSWNLPELRKSRKAKHTTASKFLFLRSATSAKRNFWKSVGHFTVLALILKLFRSIYSLCVQFIDISIVFAPNLELFRLVSNCFRLIQRNFDRVVSFVLMGHRIELMRVVNTIKTLILITKSAMHSSLYSHIAFDKSDIFGAFGYVPNPRRINI